MKPTDAQEPVNGVKVTRRKLSDYTPDTQNANRGSARGRDVIQRSFQKAGAGRSILADGNDVLIAGNQAAQGAAAAGITDVIEIETDGSAIVVVKRSDLDLTSVEDSRARELAIADNRAQELSLTWDAQQLLADIEQGANLDDLFRPDELDDLLADTEAERLVNNAVEGESTGSRLTGDKLKQIKPVLYVDEIDLFERAIRATGIDNRGQAVLAICRAYLDKA
jgi:hypothetical protein